MCGNRFHEHSQDSLTGIGMKDSNIVMLNSDA